MDRLFRKNIMKHLNKWQYIIQPQKHVEAIKSQIAQNSQPEALFIAKLGAVDLMSKVNTSMRYKWAATGFRVLLSNMYIHKSEIDYDASIDERMELIHRQNALIEQIKIYREENDSLTIDMQARDRMLRESNQTVAALTLRINYMITLKFVQQIEKALGTAEDRHLNDAFDAIIDEANLNLERADDSQMFEYEV